MRRPKLFRRLGAPTRQELNREYDADRRRAEPWRQWYGTQRWRRLAKRHLAEHPVCVMCEREGRVVPATVCDHAVPHRGDAALFWGGPFQSLCAHHHNADKQAAERLARSR